MDIINQENVGINIVASKWYSQLPDEDYWLGIKSLQEMKLYAVEKKVCAGEYYNN